jgi:hypothetical protein
LKRCVDPLISLDELEALDLALWLRTGQAAGQAMHCNQSTVSRRIRRVLEAFNGKICRDDRGLYVQSECDDLLIMERQIHQLHRLGSNGRIRLNLPAWSHRQIRDLLGEHEICSNPEDDFCCDNPLQLLRSHVIDACVVTPTQMLGESSDDLVQIDLYSVPIHLYCLADRAMDLGADDLGDPLELVATGRLALASFLPLSCKRSSQQRFKKLVAGLRCPQAHHSVDQIPVDQRAADHRPADRRPPERNHQLTFATPVMARLLPGAIQLRHDLQWPYSERLVVLRSLVDQPRIQRLISDITNRLGVLSHALAATGVAA